MTMTNSQPGSRWRQRLYQLQREVYVLYLAYRDPRTPWYGKAFAALVVAYAFSPIDLIPDPIPVLGYLDDLILIPLGIVIALRLIPAAVMADARARADEAMQSGQPVSRAGVVIVVLTWVLLATLGIALLAQTG